MTTATLTPTVKAGVSEKAFFKALGQWFSSSFAVLGELMQNAHQARASGIHFCLEGDNLVVTDDGCGIQDFQKLVQFAESGWDAETQQREDPYGMGFFSTVYTASRVIIQSRGSRLELSLCDVCEGAELRVQTDPAVTLGTRVTLVDFVTQVHNADRSPRGVAQIRQQVEHRSLGFPIEVTFNGDEDVDQAIDAAEDMSVERSFPQGRVESCNRTIAIDEKAKACKQLQWPKHRRTMQACTSHTLSVPSGMLKPASG